MENVSVSLPLDPRQVLALRAGDSVLLTGPLYTGRDAAHRRMVEALNEGRELPFDPKNQLIYYVGPAPASPGHAVGPAGPTTSYRMDAYAPRLMEAGIRGMMGKGKRSGEVVAAMKRFGCVYFGAVGGAAALISRRILKSEVVAWPDLGTEAVHRFWVENLPAVVLIDSLGNNLYESEPPKYRL